MALPDTAPSRGAFLDSMLALLNAGDYAHAMADAEAALSDPATAQDAVFVLAAVAFRSDRLANAIKMLEAIVDDSASVSDIPEILAVLNCLAGRSGEALYQAKLATLVAPQNRHTILFGPGLPPLADAMNAVPDKPLMSRGRDLLTLGQTADAIALLEQHLELFVNDVEALDLYSDALAQLGRADDAIGVLRSVMTLGGPTATLMCRLGCCLTDTGAFEQARACHAEALARAPKSATVLSHILIDLERHGAAAQSLRAEVVAALARVHAAGAPKTQRTAPRAVVRPRITIGYLCGGELTGEQREMVSRAALGHDRATVTTIGLGYGELSQAANVCYRGAFDRWIDVAPLDELTLSVIIRGEGVDVLLDADGLRAPKRPTLFARNAAPIQLGWMNQVESLPAAGGHGVLGVGECAVSPLLLWSAPAVAALPRPDRPTAFGADIRLSQLTAEVARVWSAVLNAVPGATLSLFDNGLSDPQVVARLIDMFGNFGAAHRIDIASGRAVADFLAECDVALAPFPAPTLGNYGKALSLGVPVVALDQGPSGRLAAAIRHSGFPAERMVADSTATYVAHATAWAGDLAGLARLRADSAALAAASPLFSPERFAAAIEALARDLLAKRAAAA